MISSALATTTLLTFTTATSASALNATDLYPLYFNNLTTSNNVNINSNGGGGNTSIFENISTSGQLGAMPPNGSYNPVFPSYIRTTSMVFCILIMCLGVVGNVMVPIVIFKTKDMRNSTNIFLVNLSVADLMVLLVCTPTVLVEVNSRPEVWVLGEEMCKAVPFVELTVAHASVLTILAISFERYYAICMPLKAGYICTKTRASLICLLAWFVAAVFTSPILGIAEYHHAEYFDGSRVPTCHTRANTFWPAAYFLGSCVLFFLLPFIVLIVLYLIIARNLISHAANVVLNKHLDSYSIRARKQVILMLGTVVLSFFLCLIPFRVFTIWIIIVPEEKFYALGVEKYYNILYFCRIMVYINSAINPILYNLMSSKFRTGFLICSAWRRRRHGFKLKRAARNGTFSTTANSRRDSLLRAATVKSTDSARDHLTSDNVNSDSSAKLGNQQRTQSVLFKQMPSTSIEETGSDASGLDGKKRFCILHKNVITAAHRKGRSKFKINNENLENISLKENRFLRKTQKSEESFV